MIIEIHKIKGLDINHPYSADLFSDVGVFGIHLNTKCGYIINAIPYMREVRNGTFFATKIYNSLREYSLEFRRVNKVSVLMGLQKV